MRISSSNSSEHKFIDWNFQLLCYFMVSFYWFFCSCVWLHFPTSYHIKYFSWSQNSSSSELGIFSWNMATDMWQTTEAIFVWLPWTLYSMISAWLADGSLHQWDFSYWKIWRALYISPRLYHVFSERLILKMIFSLLSISSLLRPSKEFRYWISFLCSCFLSQASSGFRVYESTI